MPIFLVKVTDLRSDARCHQSEEQAADARDVYETFAARFPLIHGYEITIDLLVRYNPLMPNPVAYDGEKQPPVGETPELTQAEKVLSVVRTPTLDDDIPF